MPVIDWKQSGTVVKNVASDISVTVYSDGAAATLTSPTVTVKRADGTTLVNSTAPTNASGVLTYTLTAANLSRVDTLEATWAFTADGNTHTAVTSHEVIGARLFTLAEARAFDGSAMTSTTTYPTLDILEAHDRILDDFTEILGYAPVPRHAREVLDGGGKTGLILTHMYPRVIIAGGILSDDDTFSETFDAADLADMRRETHGVVTRHGSGSFTSGHQNIVIEYEHGKWETPHPAVKRAALMVLRDTLVRSNVDSRATSVTEFGINWSLQPSAERGRWYGIPDVDETLNRLAERTPVVA